MNLIVLKENRQTYQPTAEQIYQYGNYLGLAFPEDQKFTPLLYEALRAPLPPGWEACQNLDEQGSILYRNKLTQQIQYDHPLDNFYKQRIIKIKKLTQNLQIQTILEEKESWLKDSSQMFVKSKDSGDASWHNQKKDQFIDQIQEEKSIFDQQISKEQSVKQQISEINDKHIIINKGIKSPRTYIKAKKQFKGIDKIKLQFINSIYNPNFSIDQIKSNEHPIFKTSHENQKMKQIVALNEDLERQKLKLKKMESQRIRKINYLQCLKNQIKIMNK